MKAAFVLHLYYPDVAVELIGRIAALGRADIDVIATHVGPLDPAVDQALDRIPGVVERIEVANRGWDIGPLFEVLPLLIERGYDVIAKLHTKKGNSGYAAEWRALAYAGTIVNEPLVTTILAAFAADEGLALAGPRPLYKSSAANQFANAELLATLAPALVAPHYPSTDWGFFAGTFFWARTELVARVADTCSAIAAAHGGDARDGEVAHAAERLFGLAPLAGGGRIGLVEGGSLAIIDFPGEPDQTPITRTLVDQAERSVGSLDDDLTALIARDNPLLHYIDHGRDADALDPNPYFSSTWYNRVNEDVAAAGVHPLHHYLHHGWRELRSTGPLFDGAHYLRTYGDVAGNPLAHFMHHGLAEGRQGLPVSDAAERAGLVHFYRTFDLPAERRFLDRIEALPPSTRLVSVIMPAFNRATTIGPAIRSVLAQSHDRLELIVVDDGSTDGTVAVVESFAADARVRLVRSDHAGVSAARNLGLEQARGDTVAYLDSDNRWVPWFLAVMLRALAAEGAAVGYSAISMRDDLGHLTGYRGAAFDWQACLERNYVDLNCFVHDRAILREIGGFDPGLRRMVDWDLILRATRGQQVVYAPFVGCDYSDGRSDGGRITNAEPAAYEKLVRTKIVSGAAIGSPEFNRALRLSFAIKVAAPEADAENWGDFHFAQSLAEAIERTGHRARVDLREQWGGHELADEDVVIVLRGLIPYAPRPGQIAFLWAISHPDQIGFDEYDRYTRVFAASPSHAALLGHIVAPPVETMLQATDPARFAPCPAADAPPLLFCGNSRGQHRAVIGWAAEAGLKPALYGSGWQDRVPPSWVRAASIGNHVLGPLYAGAGAVLNDHWPSMQAFGIVSNRLFDVAAAGGRAVSDRVPGIATLFGDAVAQVDGARGLAAAVDAFARSSESATSRQARADAVAAAHSFDVRARRLVDAALGTLGLVRPASSADDRRLHVHIIARYGRQGPQSSAFIRLIAPLTDATVADRVRVTIGQASEPVPACDVCIVQRTAFDSAGDVDRLIGRLGAFGAALVTDIDDAFRAMGTDHPEAAFYRPLVAALDRAVAASAQTWFSTGEASRAYAGIAHDPWLLPNALDPRLWRDWRAPQRSILEGDRVRMLYMGTYTHDADWQRVRPALDRLHDERPGSFSLTLIGVAAETAPAPWLERLAPPGDAVGYPRFVRWLRSQGPFDLGLAPLADSAFNRAKSDVKLLDYAALGLLPVVEDSPAYRADRHAADIAVHARDWFAALSRIMDDRDEARHRAARAADHVWQSRAVSGIAAMMLARLEALVRETRRG
jgi:hypothetical protein